MKRKACSTDTAQKPAHFLILLTRAGRMVAVHRPEENSIPLGRSSSSKIRVNDPHFPRFAGEVILRPTPLFRTPARGKGKSRLQLMRPGRPIPLPPYKLFLLEEGEVFRNRNRTSLKNLKTTGHLKPIQLLAAIVIVCVVSAAGLYQRAGAQHHDRMAVTVPFNIGHREEFTVDKPMDKPKDENKAVEHVEGKAADRPRSTPVKAKHGHRRKPGYVEEATFSRILKQAKKRLSKYDAAGAGKLITPLLPLLSPGQRDKAILALNPYAEEIFRKAYILRPFRRKESDGMMRELALSGLEILPGVRKAEGSDPVGDRRAP